VDNSRRDAEKIQAKEEPERIKDLKTYFILIVAGKRRQKR
jgi:hypothetical protein